MNKIFVTTFLLLAVPTIAGDRCTIVAGQGCGEFKIGKSKQSDVFRHLDDEKRFRDDGVDPNFNRVGVLSTLVITGRAYQTDLGLSVGDAEEKVKQAYGPSRKVERFTLSKGENEPIGFVGDRTLEYPGIDFVILRNKVWVIIVVSK